MVGQLVNHRRELIQKLQSYTVLFRDQLFVHVSPNNNFVIMTCKMNLELLCFPNIALMADHLSTRGLVLQYLYMVHGVVNGVHVPLVTVLLLDREKETYKDVWMFLIKACLDIELMFSPSRFRLDLQRDVARAAFVETFPQCTVYVDFRRLLSKWYSQITADVFGRRCLVESTPTAKWLRGVFGLFYLPADRVTDGFNELLAATPEDADPVQPFFIHVYRTYVGPDAPYPATDWAGCPQPVSVARAFVGDFKRQFVDFARTAQGRDPYALVRCALDLQNRTYRCIRAWRDNVTGTPDESFPEDMRTTCFATTLWHRHYNGHMSLLDYVLSMGDLVAETLPVHFYQLF